MDDLTGCQLGLAAEIRKRFGGVTPRGSVPLDLPRYFPGPILELESRSECGVVNRAAPPTTPVALSEVVSKRDLHFERGYIDGMAALHDGVRMSGKAVAIGGRPADVGKDPLAFESIGMPLGPDDRTVDHLLVISDSWSASGGAPAG